MPHFKERSASLNFSEKIKGAIEDIVSGVINWRPWFVMGVAEVQQRYRRSTIGPLWVTLSMAIQAAVMGFLLAFLFNQEVNRFLPFICISLIVWAYFSSALNEGAMCFIAMAGIIMQVKRPLCIYIVLVLWRNTIIFLHTIPVFFAAAWYYGIYPGSSYFLIPFALIIFVANVSWMALLLAIVSARFHDIPPITQNALNVLVWLTPVYYNPSQLSDKTQRILNFNPLTPMIEVVRGPFMGAPPDLNVWISALMVAFFGWVLTIAVFAKYRSRIPYWL